MVSSSLIYHAGNSKPPQSNAHTQEHYPKALTIAAIVTSVILWASAFPAIRVALGAYTPAEVALLRYLIASTKNNSSGLLVYHFSALQSEDGGQ